MTDPVSPDPLPPDPTGNRQPGTGGREPRMGNPEPRGTLRRPWVGGWLGGPRYWLFQILAWLGYAVFSCTAVLSNRPTAFASGFVVVTGVACLLGLAFSHALRACSVARGWTRLHWGALLLRVLPFALTYGATCGLVGGDIMRHSIGGAPALHPGPPEPRLPPDDGLWLPFDLPGGPPPPHHRPDGAGPNPAYLEALRALLSMLAWAGIYFGSAYGDQLRRSELARAQLDAAVRDAQLRALQNQLNPHFLFNGLNTIRALIDEDAGKARRVVTRFSELLRSLLRAGQTDLVPLRQELATVEAYLEIERSRYEDRLRVEWAVDPAALDAAVPPFLIQNLVENAIKHGTALQPGGGALSCRAKWEGDHLLVVVRNPGAWGHAGSGEGTGLANARTRLKLLFGEAASLNIGETDGVVMVQLRVPRVVNL